MAKHFQRSLARAKKILGGKATLGLMLIFMALFSLPASSNTALLLFDGERGRDFVGCLNCSKYDSSSICNKYGKYGSRYSSESIWNRYGNYGSKYSQNSPWNRYGKGLRIVDEDGNFYGMFTVNRSGQSRLNLVRSIAEFYRESGNIRELRDALCD